MRRHVSKGLLAVLVLCGWSAHSMANLAEAVGEVTFDAPRADAAALLQLPNDPRVEVATIRRNIEDEEMRAAARRKDPTAALPPGRTQSRPGGSLQATAISVRELIRDAYGYRHRPASDVVDGPDWIDTERYDVQAKANVELRPSSNLGLPPEAAAALKELLAERMKLRVRVEPRRKRIYELIMARTDGRPGSGLVPSKGACRSFYAREALLPGQQPQTSVSSQPAGDRACQMSVSAGGIVAENFTMEDWARFLVSRPQIAATVVDRTGLKGAFDIRLPFGDAVTGNARPSLEPALEDELGLKLRPAEAMVDVLVIEHVERPSPN